MITKISIVFSPDRSQAGFLDLVVDDFLALRAIPCLGKADSSRATREKNPTRNPLLPYGDTPLGEYESTTTREFSPEHPRMGRWVIPLIGVSGPALEAMKLRRELYIHGTPSDDGGRGETKLIPTYGCVRLLDADMRMLCSKIGDRRVEIEITETI